MPSTVKLGTRRSLLATAQSRLVARQMMALDPSVTVELVGIDTRGDQILDVPLSKMEGKDFFVAELDKALLTGEVDLTVHSMKDLSLERPAELTLAATPPRENPRDIVLFAGDILDRLRTTSPIRLGTSSPRRIENVPPFLAMALPQLGKTPRIVAEEIRGNVHSRIGRLHLPADDPRKIDAVVLAFAGLIRLWQDDAGQQELTQLLQGLRWMVLPLKECPAAPAQGALAVECRADDASTRALLEQLHDPQTRRAVQHEREILADWGGGCHQSLGATATPHPVFGDLLYLRGRKPNGTLVASIQWDEAEHSAAKPGWDGTQWRKQSFNTRFYSDLPVPGWLTKNGATFIAHSRALPADWIAALTASQQRIWTSGTRSWFRLAAKGVWVEGCAEELGFEPLLSTLAQPVLNLPDAKQWHVLTHNEGVETWQEQQIISTYAIEATTELHEDHPAVAELRKAKTAFWTSGSQFDLFRPWIPEHCAHACRYGKTYNYLREQLTDHSSKGLTAYPSAADWRARIRN